MGVGLQVSLIFWGWPMAQYPFLLPPSYTIANSAAPETTLRLTLICLAIGGVILLPSLWYLFQVFKSAPADPGDRGV
jgi:cytochrome bd ubiquinol oxidase subunit II